MPTTDTDGTTSSDTIQGWKDIASYFGRSIRSVQRWEREFGLPVHRIRAVDGQTVYAIRVELEEWRKSRDLAKLEPEDEESQANGHADDSLPGTSLEHSSTANGQPPTRSTWRKAAAALIAVLLIGLGMTIGVFVFAKRAGPVAVVYAAGNSVVAYDSLGRLVWAYNFGRPVSYTNADAGSFDLRFVEGKGPKGQIETILAVRFAANGLRSTESDALVAFDQRGTLVWKVQPDHRLQCGAETFGGPWRIYAVAASSGPGPKRVWVAFNDPTWWPGLLMEVDAEGHSNLRMISTGWIRGIAEWRTSSGTVLAISGVNNERDLPSLSLIDVDAPPTMSPRQEKRFTCDAAPASTPRRVYLFPPLDTGPSSHAFATGLTVVSNGLKVQVNNSEGTAIAIIGDDLSVQSLTFPDDYWAVHREKESRGELHHTAESCPERTRPQSIEQWAPHTGWLHSTIAAMVQQAVGNK